LGVSDRKLRLRLLDAREGHLPVLGELGDAVPLRLGRGMSDMTQSVISSTTILGMDIDDVLQQVVTRINDE